MHASKVGILRRRRPGALYTYYIASMYTAAAVLLKDLIMKCLHAHAA